MASWSRLRVAALSIALLATVALSGCLAPTLPVPPPSAGPPMYLMATNEAVVTGTANPGAYVSCLNERTETGVIVRADGMTGAFTLTIAALPRDGLQLWQEIGTNRSGSRDLCVECTAPIGDP